MHAAARRLADSPEFRALQAQRSRLSWTLTALVGASYYGFILMIALAPARFATPLHAGTAVTLGVAWGIANIVLCIALTGVYVYRANRSFDPRNQQLLDDAQRQDAR